MATPASLNPSSMTGRFSGKISAQRLTHSSSSSGSGGAFTLALSDRTVSPFATRIHRAWSSPTATGAMISALRAVSSPRRTASLTSGRSWSLRASRAIFTAVLALIPNSSRA